MQSKSLFKRVYRLNFPDLGISFDNINKEGLKVEFNIDKDLSEETNKAKITIYNLSDSTRGKIEPADTKVELYAGYANNVGVVKLFVGEVIEAVTTDEGGNVKTELSLSDGQVAIRDTIISISYSAGTAGTEIIQNIVNQMGLPVVYGDGVNIGVYDYGYSFVGNGADALTEITGAFGLTWSIQNNIVQVILAGGVVRNNGLLFNTTSGMIGSPTRIIKAKTKEDTQTETSKQKRKNKKEKTDKKAGWKVKVLLAPTLNVGDAVKVESRLIKGWFRIESLTHSGDSIGGDWVTDMELIEGVS